MAGGKVVSPPDGKFTYIGRQQNQGGWHLPKSIWHNPFTVGKAGSVHNACVMYEEYLRNDPKLIGRIHELKGQTLGCWCFNSFRPGLCSTCGRKQCDHYQCHGQVLQKILAEEEYYAELIKDLYSS
jgi:hypothetical protein